LARIKRGLCKFGCGGKAAYPKEGRPARCAESANSCPEVVKRSASGLKEHWDGLSPDGRKERSRLASEKIVAYRKGLSPEERALQLEKRSRNTEWRRKLSESRKRLIEKGLAVNLNGCGFSKQCAEFCAELAGHFPVDALCYEGDGGEAVFPGGFRADFTNLTRRFVVEFNGDYWHCNPEFWGADDYNDTVRMTASEKWEYDARRHAVFQSHGYRVIVVWETEWLTDKAACIKRVAGIGREDRG